MGSHPAFQFAKIPAQRTTLEFVSIEGSHTSRVKGNNDVEKTSTWVTPIYNMRLFVITAVIALAAGCSSSSESGDTGTNKPLRTSSSSSGGIDKVSSSSSSSNSSSSSSGMMPIEDTIRVGSLQSISTNLAPSKQPLHEFLRMLVQRQNEQGGLLGKPLRILEADIISTHLDSKFIADFLIRARAEVIFGGTTSYMRERALSSIESNNSLLFYPNSYEGEESSESVIYTGSVPNQLAIPVIDHMLSQGYERWIIIGNDIEPAKTIRRIAERYLLGLGVQPSDIQVSHLDPHAADHSNRAQQVKEFAAGGMTTVLSFTDYSQVKHGYLPYHAALAEAGVTPELATVVELRMTEEELSRMDAAAMKGHKVASNYFASINTPENKEFVASWQAYKENSTTTPWSPMASYYAAFNAWVAAVERAGTTEPDAVRKALYGSSTVTATGETMDFLANHHTTQSAYIGTVESNGTVGNITKIGSKIEADSWSDYLPESETKVADWVDPNIACGNYDTFTQRCGEYSW